MTSYRVVAVIPAYNEAATICDVVGRTLPEVDHVVVVDDGSSDATAIALQGAPITLLRNARNRGKASSLWRGVEFGLAHGAEYIVTLDGDGQHRPEEIGRLLEAAIARQNAMVVGARGGDAPARPARRLMANRIADFFISRAARRPMRDTQSGFRVYPIALLERVPIRHDEPRGFVFESEILIKAARAGYEVIFVPVSAIYGQHLRPSHFRPLRDITRIALMVAGYLLRGAPHHFS